MLFPSAVSCGFVPLCVNSSHSLETAGCSVSLKFRLNTLSASASYVSNENEINLFLFHFSILLLLLFHIATSFRDVDECKTSQPVGVGAANTAARGIPIHGRRLVVGISVVATRKHKLNINPTRFRLRSYGTSCAWRADVFAT